MRFLLPNALFNDVVNDGLVVLAEHISDFVICKLTEVEEQKRQTISGAHFCMRTSSLPTATYIPLCVVCFAACIDD